MNSSKKNFFDKTKDDYVELKSTEEILSLLEISSKDYEGDSVDDSDSVFNHYKAVAYMCAYLSKSKSECSVAMKQPVRHEFAKELDNYEKMKSVANAYINKSECSIQECVFHILPGQWLRKTFPGVIFGNSNVPEKRFQVCLNEDEIFELPEDTNKIFKRRVVDWYIDRPKYKENNYQPEELDDASISDMSNIGYAYPKQIKLLSNEKLRCRKIPYVFQYYVPNKETSPEEYAHHMLFLYYPFRDEK